MDPIVGIATMALEIGLRLVHMVDPTEPLQVALVVIVVGVIVALKMYKSRKP